MDIKIISASVRDGRNSHRVALYFSKYIQEQGLGTAEILDLKTYAFPLFEERLQHLSNPPATVLEFAGKIKAADGLIIVTPEYNGGYPASLKNIVDLLYPEWKRKPIAISTVSDGPFAGSQVITSLLFSLWKIGAWVVPAMYPVAKVRDNYDEAGNAVHPSAVETRTKLFLGELMWCIRAGKASAANG